MVYSKTKYSNHSYCLAVTFASSNYEEEYRGETYGIHLRFTTLFENVNRPYSYTSNMVDCGWKSIATTVGLTLFASRDFCKLDPVVGPQAVATV